MSAHSPTYWYDEAAPPTDMRTGNVAAFLDMLAHAEGTNRFGDEEVICTTNSRR